MIWRRARRADVEHQVSPQNMVFFSCATGIYQNFVIPYVFFADAHNPGSKYEFVVSNAKGFLQTHERALRWLEDQRGVSLTLRDVSEVPVRPHMENSIRFIVEPRTVADYVYIGDVDVMLFENVFEHHKPVFDAGLPYSNVVRPDSRRLTGLHLGEYAKQYPLGEIDDLITSVRNDEELLYAIMERKGLLYDSEILAKVLADRSPRPVHGVHLSLNRYPFWDRATRPDWEFTFAHATRAMKLLRGKEFDSFLATMEPGPRLAMANLYFLAAGIVAGGERGFDKFTQQSKPPSFAKGYHA